MSAVVELTSHKDYIVQNRFFQPGLTFVGFYARRRSSIGWEWYCGNQGWWLSQAEMPNKKLFCDGDSVQELFEKDKREAILLIAQWMNHEGEINNCGWEMFSNPLMAHALSGMDGKTYHNTLASLENGRSNGYRYFELDLSYTTDERLVCCHGWTKNNCKCNGLLWQPDFENMTYDKIMNMKVHGNPIMDARTFYKQIRNVPQENYEIDFHSINDTDQIKKRIVSLLDDFSNDKKTLNRLLIQTYGSKMYEAIDSVYHFTHYQYLVGKSMDKLDEIITYSLDQGICALAIRANLAKPSVVSKIRNAGLYVLAYTVNKDLAIADKLLQSGVNTLCTDFITNEMLRNNREKMGHHPFYVHYNSNHKEAVCNIQTIEKKHLIRTKKGNLEYKDPSLWPNTGQRKLMKNMYYVPGAQFIGWKLRINIDGMKLWLGKDHMYHTLKEINTEKMTDFYIFQDEQVIPKWTLKENSKLIMEAVWKNLT